MDAAGLLAAKKLREATVTVHTSEGPCPVTMRAMPRPDYRALVGEHPPGPDDKPGADWNEDTFPPALIAAAAIDPVFTVEQAGHVWAEWEAGEAGRLFFLAWQLNESTAGVGFISPGFVPTGDSGQNSDTVPPTESPTVSS